MSAMASPIAGVSIVWSTIFSGQIKEHIKAPSHWLFGWGVGVGIHWWPADSPHKLSVTRKTCSFDDVVMWQRKIVNKMDHWKFTQMSFRKRNCNNRCNLLRNVSLLIIYMYNTHFVFHASINRNSRYFDLPARRHPEQRLNSGPPSQYKDRLIYVWWFPC